MTSLAQLQDWRGTPIEIDSLVVFASHVGKVSFCQSEGIVTGFTPKNRVFVKVLHRANDELLSKAIIHIDPDKVTVVDSLPVTQMPLMEDLITERDQRWQLRRDNHDSHHLRSMPKMDDFMSPSNHGLSHKAPTSIFDRQAYNAAHHDWCNSPCSRCSLNHIEIYEVPCPGR